MAGQPHAAHDVDLEEPQPILVGDLVERLRLEDAEVVDQDVYLGDLAYQIRHTLGGGQVGGGPSDLHVAADFLNLLDGPFNPLLRPAVDDDGCPFTEQPRRRRQPDPGRRASYSRPLSPDSQVHRIASCPGEPLRPWL